MSQTRVIKIKSGVLTQTDETNDAVRFHSSGLGVNPDIADGYSLSINNSSGTPSTLSTGVVIYSNSGVFKVKQGDGSVVGGFAAGGDLSGTATSQTVIKIQGFSVNSVTPLNNQVLTYDATDGYWKPDYQEFPILTENGTNTGQITVADKYYSLGDGLTLGTDGAFTPSKQFDFVTLLAKQTLDIANSSGGSTFIVDGYNDVVVINGHNLALSSSDPAGTPGAITYGGGQGVIFMSDATTIPSTNPTAGFVLYSDTSNHHPTVRLTDGSVVDLTNPSSSTGPVIFDGGTTSKNLRSNRPSHQSPIDNTKNGIVNLSSDTDSTAGATGNYSTIIGGDQNVVSDAYSSVLGGFQNLITGQYSVAGGHNNNISSGKAFAVGENNIVSGNYAGALGQNAQVPGDYGFGHGVQAFATRAGQYAHGRNDGLQSAGMQYCRQILFNKTFGAGPLSAHLFDVNGNEFDLTNYTNGSDAIYYSMNVRVLMSDNTTSGKTATFVHDLLIDGANSNILIDNEVLAIYSAGASSWTTDITISGTNLRITCASDAGTATVNNIATISWTELGVS